MYRCRDHENEALMGIALGGRDNWRHWFAMGSSDNVLVDAKVPLVPGCFLGRLVAAPWFDQNINPGCNL